jgi:hypothetical protein
MTMLKSAAVKTEETERIEGNKDLNSFFKHQLKRPVEKLSGG